MAGESYNHLKIDIAPFMLPFSGTGGGDRPPEIPTVKDRRAHAHRLASELDALVRAKTLLHDADLPASDSGIHLTAMARTPLGVQATGTLMDVLSIKGEGREQRVNLFIRTDQIGTAQKRLERYASFEGAGRKPNSFSFFESTARLAATRLEDLWTDPIEHFPAERSSEARWELWVRPDSTNLIRSLAGRYGVKCEPGQTDFPSVSMIRVRALAPNLEAFVDATSAVFELRACSSLTLETLGMQPSAQRALSGNLASKISAPTANAPRVCILDTGVMATHPLLAPAMASSDCRILNPAWDQFGWNSHGTRVAGLALYRDLEGLLSLPRRLQLTTRLESVVLLRPPAGPRSLQESLGEVVAAVNMVEADQPYSRVFCLAFADYRGLNDGVPTKLSGSIDQLAWGYNGTQRLFCVAAGNLLDPLLVSGYSTRNEASGISSPGQALNALTIGGCTFRDEHPHGGQLLCPIGDISGSARTSTSWIGRRSTKPDLVFEAGNLGLPDDKTEQACESLAELNLLTTNNSPRMLLGTLGETSAATAAVAGIAGRLMARHPDYWPETIRGLLVHSASWTPAMLARGVGDTTEKKHDHVLSMFGWGVPDEDDAANSASDRLTLVIQGSLVPFKQDRGTVTLNECAYHRLPWPVTALEALGSTQAQLRITCLISFNPTCGHRPPEGMRTIPRIGCSSISKARTTTISMSFDAEMQHCRR
jgi:hypothetical protein